MRVVFLCLALLSGGAARAEGLAYLCDLPGPSSRSPLPPQLVIGYDTVTGAVVVNDPVIAQYVGIPMKGRVEAQDASGITFVWTLQGPADTAHPAIPHVDYRATVRRSDGAIAIRALLRGALAPFTAEGTCRREDIDFLP